MELDTLLNILYWIIREICRGGGVLNLALQKDN